MPVRVRSPLLSVFDTAGRARFLMACARFDLGDRLRFSSGIHDLCLGVLDLSRVRIAECVQETSKVVV